MRRVAASLPLAVVLLELTTVAVLLPDIRLDLGSSSSGAQWVLNAYLLALAALLPLLPRLRGPLLTAAGALAMAAGAVTCAAADTTAAVVAGQGVQGAGAAALLACVAAPAAGGSRPRLAAAAALPALALALGPLVGGVFAEQNWWRVFFWAGVPLAVAAGAGALLGAAGERRPVTDLARALAYAGGLAAVTIVLVQSEPWGVGSQELIQTLMIVAAGLLVLAASSRHGAPAAVWAACGAMVAALCFLAPQYFELAHLLAPLRSGVLLAALTTAAVGGGVLGLALAASVTARVLGIAGSLAAAAGLLALGTIEPHTGYSLMAPAVIVTGGGLGLAAGAAWSAGTAPPQLLEAAPAGAVLGLAAAGAVFQHVQADERAGGASFEEALARGVAVGALSLLALAAAGAASAWLIGRRP